jgi:hypothetical protein
LNQNSLTLPQQFSALLSACRHRAQNQSSATRLTTPK